MGMHQEFDYEPEPPDEGTPFRFRLCRSFKELLDFLGRASAIPHLCTVCNSVSIHKYGRAHDGLILRSCGKCGATQR